MNYEFNQEKNEILKKGRGISFEDIIIAINSGNLVDKAKHKNIEKYPNQILLFVNIKNYIYVVPCIEDKDKIFLKTIFPDRIATKKYLGCKNG